MIERTAGQTAGGRAVDVVIIGAGTAGLAAYRAAKAVTPSVLLVEGGNHGTTCARVGCMPSKLLIAAAEAAHDASTAEPFGIHAAVRIDGRAVMDRVRHERDRFVGFVVDAVEQIPAADRITGWAHFIDAMRLSVNDEVLLPRAVVVATGSSPFVPPLLADIKDRVVINDDVFAWEELPDSVVVFGAGVIGLELGQALHRLGVRVRVFGKGGRLGILTDPVVHAAALRALESEIPLDIDAAVRSVRTEGERVFVEWQDRDGQARVESFAYALAATGRRPNVRGLALEKAGLVLDERGLADVDRTTLQAGTSNVFFAGDINPDVPLLHEAADEGRIAGDNAARYPDVRHGARRSLLAIAFTDPELAVAGETFASIQKHAPDAAIGEVSFENQGRSRVMRKNRGALRVYADLATGRFLGAEMAGPRAENIAHLLAWAHQQGLTIEQMLAMPFYHPVVEEGLRTALRDALATRNAMRAVRAASSAAAP
jgi:dihydrolipoamide dehydrogenase